MACGLNKVMCDDSGGKYRKFAEQTEMLLQTKDMKIDSKRLHARNGTTVRTLG